MVPLQVLYAGQRQRRANATSLGAVIPIAIAGALVYNFGGAHPSVDLRFALLLIVGGTVGSFLGARALPHISERQLQVAAAVLLALIGLKELVLP